MAKLKLGAIADDKPVKLTVELPADVHRDLAAYTDMLARETGQSISDPAKLVAPMLARFMATDRAFAKTRRKGQPWPFRRLRDGAWSKGESDRRSVSHSHLRSYDCFLQPRPNGQTQTVVGPRIVLTADALIAGREAMFLVPVFGRVEARPNAKRHES
jgi:hypothetical protein